MGDRRCCLVVALLYASLGGCAREDTPLEDQCRRVDAMAEPVIEVLCACDVAAGDYPDLASCRAEFSESQELTDCICPLHEEHPGSKAGLDCKEANSEVYVACVQSAGCDAEKLDRCEGEAVIAALECPPVPSAFLNDLKACYDSQ